MKKQITSILAVFMLMQNSAFALWDYENVFKYDNMEDIYRFDLSDEFKAATKEENDTVSNVVKFLNALGITNFSSEKELLTREEYNNAILRFAGNNAESVADLSNVTMREAADGIAEVLGFKLLGDSEAYLSQNKVFDGITYNAEGYITKGDFAKMLANALESKYVKVVFSNGTKELILSDESYLEGKMNIYKTEGFVDSVPYMSVYSQAKANEGHVFIDRIDYFSGETEVYDLFGKRVKAYYHKNDYGEMTLKYAEQKGYSITVSVYDIDEITDEYIFLTDNGKEIKIRRDKIENFVVNGTPKQKAQIDEILDYSGDVTFSATDKDGVVNTVILEKNNYFVAQSVSGREEKIYFKYGAKLAGNGYIDLSEAEKIICLKDGKFCDYTDIKTGNSLKIFADENRKTVKIEAFSKSVSGRVTKVEDNLVVVDGNITYKISPEYLAAEEAEKIGFSSEGKFIIADGDVIAGFEPSSVMRFGFMRKIYMDEETENYYIRLYTDSGEFETFTLKDKVNLDGKKEDAGNAYQTLMTQKNTMMSFTVTTDQKLDKIDTLLSGTPWQSKDDEMKLAFEGEIQESSNYQWFLGHIGYGLDENTVVFCIPNDVESEKDYALRSPTEFNVHDGSYVPVKLYVAESDFGVCRIMEVSDYSAKDLLIASNGFYIEQFNQILDEDDEIVYEAVGTEISYPPNVVTNKHYYFEQDIIDRIERGAEGKKLGAGCFIRFNADGNNYVKDASIVFENNNPQGIAKKEGASGLEVSGTIEAFDPNKGGQNGRIRIKGKNAENNDDKNYICDVRKMIIVDTSKKKSEAYEASVSELQKGDKVYVSMSQGISIHVVVIR